MQLPPSIPTSADVSSVDDSESQASEVPFYVIEEEVLGTEQAQAKRRKHIKALDALWGRYDENLGL